MGAECRNAEEDDYTWVMGCPGQSFLFFVILLFPLSFLMSVAIIVMSPLRVINEILCKQC